MMATNSPCSTIRLSIERMNVDIADMIGPRNAFNPDNRFWHYRAASVTCTAKRRGGGTLERAFAVALRPR